MTAAGVIVAAGSGERLRGTGPKGFAVLAGEPLLVHAVRAFVASEAIGPVVLVVGAEHLDEASAALQRAGLAVSAVVAGGDSRQESVRMGLAACPVDAEVVAVHDAARPLVSARLVARTVAALVDPWVAVAPGLPVVDTMKLVEASAPADGGGRVLRTVARSDVWSVQTPQVFSAAALRAVHARPAGEVTDDLMLIEREGGDVRLIEGDPRNFKITYRSDLAIAEALLAVGHP